MRVIRKLLGIDPVGYALVRVDGQYHNRIRGDLIPRETVVIIQDGRSFVRAGEPDRFGFEVYREGHATHEYQTGNEAQRSKSLRLVSGQ